MPLTRRLLLALAVGIGRQSAACLDQLGRFLEKSVLVITELIQGRVGVAGGQAQVLTALDAYRGGRRVGTGRYYAGLLA